MEEVKEEEDIPQEREMQEQEYEEECDYEEDELSEEAMLRANEIVNSDLMDIMAREEHDDAPLAPRPRIANRVQARFINAMCNKELGRIDAMLRREAELREEFHRRQREQDQRQEEAMASGNLPPDEIPDVPEEKEVKEEQPPTKEQKEETAIYQDELETRKNIDIFSQSSSADSLSLLAPETEPATTGAQDKMEKFFMEKPIYSKPFQNKNPEGMDQPLEKEPRVRVEVPGPKPVGDEQDESDVYKSALDGLSVLDRHYKSKNFGFYGKGFRQTHKSSLNFTQFRKEPLKRPCAKFDIDEQKFIEIYCGLFFEKPTPEDYFCQKVLADQLRFADKGEISYNSMITDITELFLSGESIERNPETVGSSSKSLTVMFWNLGNWSRGSNFRVPGGMQYPKFFYKEEKPDRYPEHVATYFYKW